MSDESPAAHAPRRVTAADLFDLRFISDPRIHPGGAQVAFVLSRADKDDNTYRSHIWLQASDGSGRARRFTNGAKRDSDPHWSPDGRFLAFVSNRVAHSEIWIIPTDGGEARRLTHTAHGATSPRWRPDGRAIAFLTALDDGDPAPGRRPIETEAERTARHEKRDKAEKEEPRRISRLQYKADGEGFLEARKTHIWVVDLDDDGTADGDPRPVTEGDWDDSAPAWSPDGQWIAFVSNRTPDRDDNTVTDIWVAPATGGDAWPLTTSQGNAEVPAWSPDGRWLAYVGHENRPEGGYATNQHLYALPMGEDGHPAGERLDLSGALDRIVGCQILSDMRAGPPADVPQWAPDSAAIYYLVSDWGRSHLYSFSLGADVAPQRVLDGDRAILNISLSADGTRLAYTATDPTHPGDLWSCALAADGTALDEQQLTEVNARYLREHTLGTVGELLFNGDDGTPLQGWIMRPPGYTPDRQYPAVVEIHGGPHLLYGFAFVHEFQVLAAQGYIVFYMNPRGSQGYGEGFSMAIRHQWGIGPDFPDLMAGTDALLATEAVDPANVGVTGGSYGGYMTCWIVGHTDRFKTALAQRSLTNMISFWGTSDAGWMLADWEFNPLFSTPETYQHYWQVSPLAYAPQINTPLMLIHPENDLRCPVAESEQLYVALKRLGKTVELVRFPGGSHGLSRNGPPVMRVHRLNVIRDWMVQYLGTDDAAAEVATEG